MRSRLILTSFALGLATIAVAYVLAVPRTELTLDVILLVATAPLAVLLSGVTEKHLVGPAERIMNLMTGFGGKGQDAEFDEKGVPIVSLRRLGEKVYNPVAVAMAAMRYHAEWKETRAENTLAFFRNCCDSLLENLTERTAGRVRFHVWEYHYPFTYGMAPPWVSGLAQGVGVHVLSVAHRLTGDNRFLVGAQNALTAFWVPVREGGVTYKDSEREWWYEEFACPGAQESRVLNGMLYALVGICEYGKNTGDPRAADLLDKGMARVRTTLSSYDSGWWTYYDVVGTVATRSYHSVHVDLMRQLYEATDDRSFLEACHRWSGYRCHFFLREFVRSNPSWHDKLVLSLNVIGAWLLGRLALLAWAALL